MKLGGALDSKNAARLLSAAAVLDFMFLGFVLVTAEPALRQLAGVRVSSPSFLVAPYVVLVLTYWLICEAILGGHTVGRFALRLTMRDKNGKPLSSFRRSTRAIKKVLTLGLTGVNPNAASRYDKAAGVVWYSPMASRPIGNWRLTVQSGADRGKTLVFHEASGLKSTHSIKIGRDPGWSDLALSQSVQTSGRHCLLRVDKSGEMFLRDMGSSNGTWVGNRRVGPDSWVPVGSGESFRVANVRIGILR